MSSSTNSDSASTAPVHLWVVAVLSVLWNAMGVFDYLMTQTANESYMSQFTTEQLEFYQSFPVWVEATWAIAVWGGMLGAVLLLLRRSLTVPIFTVALAAMVVTTVHNYGISNGFEVAGGAFPIIFTGVIFVVGIAQILYAKAMAKRGVLR